MSVEAMLGARGSFDPFVGHARPHPGQIESAHLIWSLLSESKFAQGDEVEVTIEEDQGVLRQDRYSLRTAPQWLGPQFEDIKRVQETIRIEVNSTTDNPLVEPPREAGEQGAYSSCPNLFSDSCVPGNIHHAGNFQALSVTNAMDHLRLSLSHIGRLMFVQLTELVNPVMNRGLPGNLSGGESALDFGCKGVDIAAASYTGELNALGGMNVGVGNVSAEMHNQSVKLVVLSGKVIAVDNTSRQLPRPRLWSVYIDGARGISITRGHTFIRCLPSPRHACTVCRHEAVVCPGRARCCARSVCSLW